MTRGNGLLWVLALFGLAAVAVSSDAAASSGTGPAPSSGGPPQAGSTGAAVVAWQKKLIAAGYDLGPAGADGKFGSKTTAATVAFQRAHQLKPDGVVGSKTLAAMSGTAAGSPKHTIDVSSWPVLRAGQSSEATRDWQLILVSEGFLPPSGVDGAFGSKTTAATKAYQTSHGLAPTGEVGPEVVALLLHPNQSIAGDEGGELDGA